MLQKQTLPVVNHQRKFAKEYLESDSANSNLFINLHLSITQMAFPLWNIIRKMFSPFKIFFLLSYCGICALVLFLPTKILFIVEYYKVRVFQTWYMSILCVRNFFSLYHDEMFPLQIGVCFLKLIGAYTPDGLLKPCIIEVDMVYRCRGLMSLACYVFPLHFI